MIAAIGLIEGDSMLRAITDTPRMEAAVANWEEVAQHLIVRLRTESAFVGGDPVLEAVAFEMVEQRKTRWPDRESPLETVVPIRFKANDMVLSLFSTIAQFGTAEDIVLVDLRIEMYFPADQQTRQTLLNLPTG